MSDADIARRSCLASNVAWRRQASHLRHHAAIPHPLTPDMVAQLRADRAACADRRPSSLQREMLGRIGSRK